MDLADLATYKAGTLSYYEPATELRQRDLDFRRLRRNKVLIPTIQFSPVEKVALEIAAFSTTRVAGGVLHKARD